MVLEQKTREAQSEYSREGNTLGRSRPPLLDTRQSTRKVQHLL